MEMKLERSGSVFKYTLEVKQAFFMDWIWAGDEKNQDDLYIWICVKGKIEGRKTL